MIFEKTCKALKIKEKPLTKARKCGILSVEIDKSTIFFPISTSCEKEFDGLTIAAKEMTSRTSLVPGLVVKDMFGEEFLRSNCDFTDNDIPSNSSITVTELYLDINQFMANHLKLFNTDYDDLVFEYEVKNVIFTN